MKKLIFILLISLQSIIAQEILNNDSILEMMEIGFDESLIIDKINNSQNTFETSISSLKELKNKGISQNILSSMINASKKIKKTDEVDLLNDFNNGAELNNLEYTFTNGIDKYTVHLLKDEYFKDLKGPSLEVLINLNIALAVLKLKSRSTYKPRFIQLKRTKKGKNKISILGSAQNDYGGIKDGVYENNFTYTYEPLLSNEQDNSDDEDNYTTADDWKKVQNLDYKLDNNMRFNFKYDTFNGVGKKMDGELIIGENYIVIASDLKLNGVKIPDVIFPIKKKYLNENDWESKYNPDGNISTLKYNSKPGKYKSTGGIFTMSDPRISTTIFYLYLKKT